MVEFSRRRLSKKDSQKGFSEGRLSKVIEGRNTYTRAVPEDQGDKMFKFGE